MSRWVLLGFAALGLPLSASAVVLDFRPNFTEVPIGGQVDIEVYAVSSTGQDTPFSALDIVVTWDTTYLGAITALDSTSQYSWGASGFRFPTLNGNLSDGNAEWSGERQLFSPAPVATAAGLRLTTFRFTALAPTPTTTTVNMPLAFGGRTTRVFDAFIPNTNILSSADPGAVVRVVPEPATLLALSVGLGALARKRRRKS